MLKLLKRLARWWSGADETLVGTFPADATVKFRMSGTGKEVSVGVNVEDTEDGKRWAIIAAGACPHCKRKTRFYEGPSGGLSTNIQCEKCGWWFNVTPVIGIAQDIGEKDDREKKNPSWRPEI